MVINGWKVVAWIFIVLFVLETLFIVYAYNLAVKVESNKIKCSNEICFEIDSSAFLYDDATKTCSCYINDKIAKQVILK